MDNPETHGTISRIMHYLKIPRIQWNLYNPTPEFFNMLGHPRKSDVPKVFLLTKSKPEYSDILYNPTHFHGSLVCRIRQVPLHYLILKSVVSWPTMSYLEIVLTLKFLIKQLILISVELFCLIRKYLVLYIIWISFAWWQIIWALTTNPMMLSSKVSCRDLNILNGLKQFTLNKPWSGLWKRKLYQTRLYKYNLFKNFKYTLELIDSSILITIISCDYSNLSLANEYSGDVAMPTQVIKYDQHFLQAVQPIRLQYSNQIKLFEYQPLFIWFQSSRHLNSNDYILQVIPISNNSYIIHTIL